MRIGKIKMKRRVWICLIFAVGVSGLWWIWTRARTQIVATATPPVQPVVRLAKASSIFGADNIMRERAEYFDPTPLFFPTQWNFGQGALRESMKRQPGQVFDSFEAKFVYGEQNIKPYNSEAISVPGLLAEVVASGNETPFGGLGEIDAKSVTLSERSGFLEVTRLLDGKTIVEQPLVGISLTHPDFAPLEFLVVINSAGMVAEPVLMRGSGWEEIDVFLRTYLAKTFRIGERLNPGIYRVLIGP